MFARTHRKVGAHRNHGRHTRTVFAGIAAAGLACSGESSGDDETGTDATAAADATVQDAADDGSSSDLPDTDTLPDSTQELDSEGSDAVDATVTDPDAVVDPDAVNSELVVVLDRLFPTDTNAGVQLAQCTYASPLAWSGAAGTEVLQVAGEVVVGLSPQTGQELWRVVLPAPEGEVAVTVATPVLVGDLLVVGYGLTGEGDGPRSAGSRRNRHWVAVVDLAQRAISSEFPPVEITGEFIANDGETVIPFRPTNALNRAALAHGVAPGDELGRVYVTFGNLRDIQPWHGMAFEVSLDVWRRDGADAAITGQLITTPEADCGPAGASGSSERICGGGLWGPGGHLVIPRGDTFELILPTGNGQLNVERRDFSNSLLRTGPGLDFDAGCDAVLCASFNPESPSLACVESCTDAFIHRFPEDETMPAWGFGVCDGLTMYECWGKLDYTGGSTPILVELPSGTEVIVSTGKDGGLYLVDPTHLGRMLDRLQITDPCGMEGDACIWNWAGTIVATPVHARINDQDLILVPTFMPDRSHDAGVVAVTIVETDDGPRLQPAWNAPERGTEQARTRFRRHTSRLSLQELPDTQSPPSSTLLGWVVEAAPPNQSGRLFGVNVSDGTIVADEPLVGPGYRFTRPLVLDDRVYVPSCTTDDGPSFLEAYRVRGE